jgi:hypothetical protein
VAGSVRADVAKQGRGETFVIRTHDAEVEVRGTSFEVVDVPADPACGGGTTTRVRVHEGVVAVRSRGVETLVHPSETWPPECASSATPAPPPTPTPAPAPAPPSAFPSAPASAVRRDPPAPPRVSGGTAESSDLTAQNDLFEVALARKRARDPRGAIAALDDLLARYPETRLGQTVRAERMKLLRDVDPGRARVAAKDYRDRYPTGFARADADAILGE